MKIIKIQTSFNFKNLPKINKKDFNWEQEGFPNNMYIDNNYIPKKYRYISIYGANLLSDNEDFLLKNKIFKTFNNIEIKNFAIELYDDDYLKLREKNKHFGDFGIIYDEDQFEDKEDNPTLIHFDIMLQTAEFDKVSKDIDNKNGILNFEMTINFNENEIFSEDKKKEGVESARYDVVDFKLLNSK